MSGIRDLSTQVAVRATVGVVREVLADHHMYTTVAIEAAGWPRECSCGQWVGPSYEHPTHQAQMLDAAGLLAG